jgi:hypothetical protein
MSEGYVAVAMDDSRYMDLAANLALSIRRLDTRPISVIVNKAMSIKPEYRPLFDSIIEAPDEPDIRGAMNKARLYQYTPYERTMYVDTDCILFSHRIEFFWRKLSGHPFALEGLRQTTGPVFACSLGVKDAGLICARMNVPHVIVCNTGVMYFERSELTAQIFKRVLSLYRSADRDHISYPFKHQGEYNDEPFFGVALPELNVAPLDSPLMHRMQVTTPNMIDGLFDLDLGNVQVLKQIPGQPAQSWSGAICHFCGLAPMDTYFDLADRLRREGGFSSMDRSQFTPVVLQATPKQISAELSRHP